MKEKCLRFKCLRCGKCCGFLNVQIVIDDFNRWSEKERWDILSKVIKVPAGSEAEKFGIKYFYTFKKENGRCPFLKDNTCTIYEDRPLICRLFPFALSPEGKLMIHPWARENCPGIKKGDFLSENEVRMLLRLARKIGIQLLMMSYCMHAIDELISSAKEKVKEI